MVRTNLREFKAAQEAQRAKMRTKHAAKKDKSHRLNLDDSERFASGRLKKRYEGIMCKRGLFPESGFLIEKGKPNLGLPTRIGEVIQQHGWVELARHPGKAVTAVVREFYAAIQQPKRGVENPSFSMVRQVRVPFSAATINAYFGLSDVEDEYEEMLEKTNAKELDAILKEVALEGTTWTKLNGSHRKCKRNKLRPMPKVWYHVVRTGILPTTHMQTVNRERLILLSCLLKGKKIDVGRLVEKEIHSCAKKKKGSLFFPCLITELCIQEGVPVAAGEDVWPNTRPIDTMVIRRFAGKEMKGDSEEAVTEPSQEFMENQRKFWEYARAAFTWQQQAIMQLSGNASLPPPPIFPEEILLSRASKPAAATDSPKQSAPVSPSHPPAGTQTRKKTQSRKGKEKVMVESEEEEELESEEEEELESEEEESENEEGRYESKSENSKEESENKEGEEQSKEAEKGEQGGENEMESEDEFQSAQEESVQEESANERMEKREQASKIRKKAPTLPQENLKKKQKKVVDDPDVIIIKAVGTPTQRKGKQKVPAGTRRSSRLQGL